MVEYNPIRVTQDPQSDGLKCNLASTLAGRLRFMPMDTVFRRCASFQVVDDEG